MGEASKKQQDIDQLRQRVAEHQQVRDELARQLRTFRVRYRRELGPLVEKLLQMRRKRMKDAAHTHQRSARVRNAYREAEADYERFRRLYEEAEEDTGGADASARSLTDDEQQRLKSAYREASKKCHPDMVEASQKEEAERAFHALREAYQANDLEEVEGIARELTEGGIAEQASPHREEALRKKLQTRLDELRSEINDMRASDAYQVLSEVSDVDRYFEQLRAALKAQVRRFERRVSGR